jgi:soluble lytic murein transglycosylase-like protein
VRHLLREDVSKTKKTKRLKRKTRTSSTVWPHCQPDTVSNLGSSVLTIEEPGAAFTAGFETTVHASKKEWGNIVSFYFKLSVALSALLLCIAGAAADNIPPEAVPSAENSANLEALVSLAARHEHAEGMPRDYTKAAALYCSAAKTGYAAAQYALGWMYANGRGVSKDDGVAAQLFAMAAAQGHEHAKRMLGYTSSTTSPTSSAPLPTCLQPDPPRPEAQQEQQEETAIYPEGPILTLVNKLAPRYNVDPKLALAIISVESGFNSRAISPKNAQGLMQLIPQTAERFRVKNPFDAEENIKGGLAYLQWLLAFFQGDVRLVVAAYNAGERAVERYRGIPPYRETQNYVQKVTGLYKKSNHPFQHNLAPSIK